MRHHSRPIRFALALCVLAVTASAGRAATAPAPDPAVPPEIDHCGTWRALSPPVAGASSPLVARPPQGPLKLFSTHFVVHYATAGFATYAQDVSDAAELTYRVLVDTLAHEPPVPDGTAGGDARVDIYLRPVNVMGSAYGTTYRETLVGTPYPNSYTSWIELVDTMGVARRVTITAHEVYHTIQLAYDAFESTSLLEMLSTWVQDRVYDAYNLHYDTLRLFFRQPQRGLFLQTYTNVPWAIYLTEHYGDGILQQTLVACAAAPGPNPRDAFDTALGVVAGTTFLDEFIRFGTFNYFVGGRDDGAHYSEGADYYTTTLERNSRCFPQPLFVSIHPPAELGTNYALLDGDGRTDPLKLYIYPEYLASTILTMTRFKGAVQSASTKFYAKFSTPVDSILISDWAECDSVLLVYQVDVGSADNSFGYAAVHTQAPPPPGNWVLVLDRDGCRAPFNGVGDDFMDRDGEDAPFSSSLRGLGVAVLVSDSLPPDLSACRGVFLIGGFDAGGVNLSGAELTALNSFMDGGGDVYVEGSRLGEYMDPSLGAGSPTEQAFWGRFGCSFIPGASSGNLTSWETTGNAFMGTHTFAYDAGAPNAYVGRLVPGSASFLATDDNGFVRATVRRVAGSSTRVMSTVLLGGSTGTGGTTRDEFVNDVLLLFDTNVAALAVARATVSVDGRDVAIDGVLEHYDDQRLVLQRVEESATGEVAMDLRRVGGEWRFFARDRLTSARATYRLLDADAGRALWEQTVAARTPVYALRLVSVYPTPARDEVRLVIESPSDADARLGVYDVAGRRVSEEPAALRTGSNVLYLRRLPDVSGVYFVRVDVGSRQARGRLLVLR